jgi:hypothetical protein
MPKRPAPDTSDPGVPGLNLDEASALVTALEAGTGLTEDQIDPIIVVKLLEWADQMRIGAVLVDMAIRGEVVIRMGKTAWEFRRVGGKEN